MKTKCYLLFLAVLVVLLGSLSLGCQSRYYSEEEVVTLVWNQLPNDLGEFSKSQLVRESREVTYQGKQKWLFEVSGSGRKYISSLSGWRKYATDIYDFKLTAYFYEKTGVIEILDIEEERR